MTKLVLLALSTYVFANADTLVLKNGSHLEGIFLGGDSRTVKFEANDHVVAYPVADVDSVRFASGAASTPVPSTAPVPSPVRPAVQIMANTPIASATIPHEKSGRFWDSPEQFLLDAGREGELKQRGILRGFRRARSLPTRTRPRSRATASAP